MIAMLARSMGRVTRSFTAILLVLLGFQVTIIAVAASLADSGDLESLAGLVPAALQSAFAPALGGFDRMATLGYFEPGIVLVLVQWAIYVAAEPAGEIESGIVDLVYARPMPRHRLVTRSLIVMAGSTLALALAMGLGTVIGLSWLAPSGVAWPAPGLILLMMAHLVLLVWCFGAAALAVAGWARRRGAVIAVVAIASIVLFLIDFLGLWWAPAEALAHASPFFYFHGGAILSGTARPVLDFAVLGGATVVAMAVAYWQFERRDL
jgi:ABC-type transport system involved in multi-copper enzyme maturation permease subunit